MNNFSKTRTGIEKKFFDFLERCEKEQIYQDFIEKNTQFVPREFVQNHGIHFNLVLRKLRISHDYICDFAYLCPSSSDWNCVLVEIEKPSSKYFSEGTNRFHKDFENGLSQITRWRAWFNNNDNFNHFTNTIVGPLRLMEPLKCYIKYVLVFGRRKELESNSFRKDLVNSQEREDFKIISFDSLSEDLESKNELYLCVRKNEYFEIRSTNYVEESVFVYMPPEQIRINEKLRSSIIANKCMWTVRSMKNNKPILAQKLPKIRNY